MTPLALVIGFPKDESRRTFLQQVVKKITELGHNPAVIDGIIPYALQNFEPQKSFIPLVIVCTDRYPEGLAHALREEPLINLRKEIKSVLENSVKIENILSEIPDIIEMQSGKLSLWKHKNPSTSFKSAVEFIYKEIKSPDLSVEMIAKKVGRPIAILELEFSANAQSTIWQFVVKSRMEIAKMLLRTSQLDIFEIALSSGYSDQSNFTRAFRNFFGLAPRSYRSTVANETLLTTL